MTTPRNHVTPPFSGFFKIVWCLFSLKLRYFSPLLLLSCISFFGHIVGTLLFSGLWFPFAVMAASELGAALSFFLSLLPFAPRLLRFFESFHNFRLLWPS